MSDLIPDEQLKNSAKMNLAPLIDFLFIMLTVFATLAITQSSLSNTHVELVRLQNSSSKSPVETKTSSQIHLQISSLGEYSYLTKTKEYPIETVKALQAQLLLQYANGYLPKDKKETKILLHIDRTAPWERVAELLFAIRDIGFEGYPLYTKPPKESFP